MMEETYTIGYIATRDHVSGKPKAVLVRRYPDGHLASLFAPSVDQDAQVHETQEAAIEEAKRRWRR